MITARLVLVLVLLATPLAATAQPVGKVPRIGVISLEPSPSPGALRNPNEGFRQGMRELGYV